MENANWYFTKEQLANSPSRKSGIDYNRELSYRQQAANFIQDMGQRLQVSQLCINTAIVYMHRFYSCHSFSDVHRNNIAVAALFLAAKVEEQPRKVEQVIKMAHMCLHKDGSSLDVKSEAYSDRMNEIVFHENLLLQTLGFVLAIEHPHTYVVKVCQLVKASKDLAQTSYIMATTSLHMTTMCLMYQPTLVACVCIHLACKWSNYMIGPCTEGKDWFFYVDKTVNKEMLEKLTQEYISILERSPHRFKKKFAKDAASGYHGPSSITIGINESSLSNRPSTSSEGSSNNRESSPCTSYDFGAAFEEKRALESPPGDKPPSIHVQSSQPALPAPPKVSIKKEKVEPPLAVKTEPHALKPEPHPLKPKHRLPVATTTNNNSNNVPPVSSTLPTSKYTTHVKVEITQESPVVKPKLKVKEEQPVPEVLQPPPPPPPALLTLPQVPRGLSPIKDVKTNGSKEDQVAERKPHENNVSVKKTPEGKHEKREKHKKHSSKDRSVVTNHSTGIKVKIRKDCINLSDTKMPLKIKLPKPPMPETPPLPPVKPPRQETAPIPSLKLVLTKDKSGSCSYSTSQHKNDRERKRGHSDAHKNSHEGPPPSKYHKSDHGGAPKTHDKPPKVHSRHRGSEQHVPNSSRPDNSTFQNYGNNPGYQNYRYQMTPPPPPPKLRGHNLPRTNSNLPPLPPPLPPPPPPPPE